MARLVSFCARGLRPLLALLASPRMLYPQVSLFLVSLRGMKARTRHSSTRADSFWHAYGLRPSRYGLTSRQISYRDMCKWAHENPVTGIFAYNFRNWAKSATH